VQCTAAFTKHSVLKQAIACQQEVTQPVCMQPLAFSARNAVPQSLGVASSHLQCTCVSCISLVVICVCAVVLPQGVLSALGAPMVGVAAQKLFGFSGAAASADGKGPVPLSGICSGCQ
jgi:hypothetical protein